MFVGVSFNLGSLVGAATGGLLGGNDWLAANLASGCVPLLVVAWALASKDSAEDHGKGLQGRLSCQASLTSPGKVGGAPGASPPAASRNTEGAVLPPPSGTAASSTTSASATLAPRISSSSAPASAAAPGAPPLTSTDAAPATTAAPGAAPLSSIDAASVACCTNPRPYGPADVTATQADATATHAKATATQADARHRLPRLSHGLRSVIRAAEFHAVLLAYMAQGIFQGSFFSLVPVIFAGLTSNSTAPRGPDSPLAPHNASNFPPAVLGDTASNLSTTFLDPVILLQPGSDVASADSAPVIAAVIMAAGALQIGSNLLLVRPSLRRWGSLGHTAVTNAIGSVLLAVTAVLLATMLTGGATEGYYGGSPPGTARSTAVIAALCALFALAYVASASSLTVLNQQAAGYARWHGAPVGTVTGISRSVFSILFGVAPAASIRLSGVAVWLPVAAMSALFAVIAATFGAMAIRRWPDVVPATSRAAKQGWPPIEPKQEPEPVPSASDVAVTSSRC